ncbi:MAG TPA: quinol:electron acceptor oxidoreductase subunit ActD [Ignavibacteriales bacterium]|nr:quinol:electron acceptor oxidoreductase subunit ActD [Ignavibacteriales bacterium]
MDDLTGNLTLTDVDKKVLKALKPPVLLYYLLLAGFLLVSGAGFLTWIYMVRTGMGVTGLNHPIGWATYIGNFVFWVGIAHSGTLISAIFFLVRAKFRDAVSRSAEAMTLIAIMIAGLFPLMHLGRLWVFYYILPYPSERQIWPNFKSPLVWDVLAVFTYFVVSLIFFYVGLIPDAAAARDKLEEEHGKNYWRTKLFRRLSLGWSGALSQWRHYNRAYLFFAALATPLVISVHSIVSWDFATSLLPGWHSTLFAPYFVAGAIHSGLAMVILIMIPLRKVFSLEEIITPWHLEMVAKTMIVTTLIMAYSYTIEPFMAAYSKNMIEWQFSVWRRTGWLSWSYYPMLLFNALIPLSLIFKKVRTNFKLLPVIAVLVVMGMWLERYFIVVGSTAHDFLPHAWDSYAPTWVEVTITAASFCFFFFLFLLFSKNLPVVPLADFKSQMDKKRKTFDEKCNSAVKIKKPLSFMPAYKFIFSEPDEMLRAVKILCDAGYDRMEVFSPTKIEKLEAIVHVPVSPVKYWALFGAIFGFFFGLVLAIGTSQLNDLIVGGKPPVTLIPYWIVAFEGGVLFGALFNLIGLIIHAHLFKTSSLHGYEPRFSKDKYGVIVQYSILEGDKIKKLAEEFKSDEMSFSAG